MKIEICYEGTAFETFEGTAAHCVEQVNAFFDWLENFDVIKEDEVEIERLEQASDVVAYVQRLYPCYTATYTA